MPQNSCNQPALPLLVLLSQADPLRRQLREYAVRRNRQALFFDHLCQAVGAAPLAGPGQAAIVITRPALLTAAGAAAFGMLYGRENLRCILWGHNSGVCGLSNTITIYAIEQLDAALAAVERQPDNTASLPAAVVAYCPAINAGAAGDFRLTEEELNALLGA